MHEYLIIILKPLRCKVTVFFFFLHYRFHVGSSSLTKDQTQSPPALGAWNLSHKTTREGPEEGFSLMGQATGLERTRVSTGDGRVVRPEH